MDNTDYPVFFDLQKKLTTDQDFCEKVQGLMSDVATAYARGNVDLVKKKNTELLKLCAFNPSLLLPYFYPDFLDGEPMTLWSRPHAFAMMAMIPNGSLTIAASRQIGKCITGEAKINVNKKRITIKELFDRCKKKKEELTDGEN